MKVRVTVPFWRKLPPRRPGLNLRKFQTEDMSVCAQVIGSAAGVTPAMPGYYGAIFAEVDTENGEVNACF